ncbi:NUDIX hydrolase [Vreelandella sp. GE22]
MRDTNQDQPGPGPHPIPATIAAVVRDGSVLLVKRSNPPDAGRWGFPGGKIERGEPIEAAALRELREETGVNALAERIFNAADAFDYDHQGELRHHYLLIAVLCKWREGEPLAGDDALEARWVPIRDLATTDLALSIDVADIARQAGELSLSMP